MDKIDKTELFEHMDVSQEELKRLRSNLEQRFTTVESHKRELKFGKYLTSILKAFKLKSFKRQYTLAGFASTVTILFMVYFYSSEQTNFNADFNSVFSYESLEDIKSFVAENGNYQQMFSLADELSESEDVMSQLNGLLVLSLLGTDGVHRSATAKGLIEDPRAEFRIYYLEYLLDYASHDHFNIDYIDQLITRETNQECLFLLRQLRNLALRNPPTGLDLA